MLNTFIIISGVFYSVLCVFSIVTGLIYMSGKRKLNPLELPDRFVEKLKNNNQIKRFTFDAGLLTFVVGVVQGITAYSFIFKREAVNYYVALGFTIFSICSVAFKLKGKINIFPILKLVAYILILIVIIIGKSLYSF